MVKERFHSKWVFPVLLGLMCAQAFAQISFQHVLVQEALISPSTLFTATLHNAGPTAMVHFEGEVRTRSGEDVLRFASLPFTVPAGMSSVNAGQLTMRTFVHGTGDAGRHARLFQRLAGGHYRWCMRLVPSGSETNDQYCDELMVEDLLFLDLVMPWNGDTIDEVRPSLTWTFSGSTTGAVPDGVRLVLAPMPKDMRPAQALVASPPMFMVPEVGQRTVPYPPGIDDLQRGHCYAWQVERLVDGRVADRSDPWGFCVRERKEPVHNKYVHLDRIQSGVIYEALDEKIFFRYDEPYASKQLYVRVRGVGGRHFEPRAEVGGAAGTRTGLRSIGVNLYEVDLQPYGLKPGVYDLIVHDEKSRVRSLKFRISR